MLRLPSIFLSLILPLALQAQWQLNEDFLDSNWASSAWYGDTATFQRLLPGIRIRDSLAGSRSISHPCPITQSATWQLHGRFDFNPSSSNYLDFDLMQEHLSQDSSNFGYRLRIGGNSKDQLQFYRLDTNTQTLLWSSPEDWLNRDPLHFHLKLFRDSLWNWSFWADTGQFNHWQYLGSTPDSNHRFNQAIRLQFNYTKTRSDKFYIDSLFLSGRLTADGIAPYLENYQLQKDSLLHLRFNEKLQRPFPSFSHPYLNVSSFSWSPQRPRSLLVRFNKVLLPNTPYQLAFQGIQDLFGNTFQDTVNLLLRVLEPGDLRISEIMADPSPKVDPSPLSFPETEYLELYNASQLLIPLEGLQIQIGSRQYELPHFDLPPDSLVVLCTASMIPFWPKAIIVLPMSWSSAALSNDGTQIYLRDKDQKVIESLNYQKDWYQDPLKEEGGWSLERQDLLVDCQNRFNWSASTNPSGGSPGQVNSNQRAYHDSLPLVLDSWGLAKSNTLKLEFNRRFFFSDSAWVFNPKVSIDSMVVSPEGLQISFYFQEALEEGDRYNLSLRDSLRDCRAKGYWLDSLWIGIPRKPQMEEVYISELLFNPRSGGVDFVEVYNSGNAFLDLADLRLALWDPETQEIGAVYPLAQSSRIIGPKEVIVLSEDPEIIREQYSNIPGRHQEVFDLPALPDQAGAICLLRSDLLFLDGVAYDDEAHSPFLANTEGCSIYRLDYSSNAIHPWQWQSTPGQYNYASPGWIPELGNQKVSGQWSATTEYLSPNADGYKDHIEFHYQLSDAAWLQVSIIDGQGSPQKVLEPGAYHTAQGVFIWKGDNEQGEICAAGVYIAYLEYRLANGEMARLRCSFVLSR